MKPVKQRPTSRMKHAYEIPDQAQQGHEPPGDEKYGPKEVQKGAKNPPRERKSPVKQANRKPNEGQKEVKNGPKKQTQKRNQKSTEEDSQKSRREIDGNAVNA